MKLNTKKKLLAFIIFVLSLGQINAQTETIETQYPQPPIPIVVSDNSSTYQSVISRQLFSSVISPINKTVCK